MRSSLALPFILWLALVLGCAGANRNRGVSTANSSAPAHTSTPTPSPVVDIPKLIGKTPAELDSALGRPAEVTKITNNREMMPGEYRDYEVPGSARAATSHGLMVRFYKGRAVLITYDLPAPTSSPEDALRLAGIEPGSAKPSVVAPMAQRWSGTFNGVNFGDAAALMAGLNSRQYTTVQAELNKP
jgi:hypothetical protein